MNPLSQSRNWFVRLNRFLLAGMDIDLPKSVCTLFWSTVFGVGAWGFLIFVGSAVAFAATSPIWYWFFPNLIRDAGGLALAAGTIEIILLFVLWFFIRKDRRETEELELQYVLGDDYKAPEPSVIWEFIVATHRKMCPLIEYVD